MSRCVLPVFVKTVLYYQQTVLLQVLQLVLQLVRHQLQLVLLVQQQQLENLLKLNWELITNTPSSLTAIEPQSSQLKIDVNGNNVVDATITGNANSQSGTISILSRRCGICVTRNR